MSTTHYAASHNKTRRFMRDLMITFKEHNMAIVPTYQGEVSFHDSMRVVPLDVETRDYVNQAGMDPEDFKPPF